MMFHDFPWFSMIYHDFPWFTMIFHDFPWFSMIYHDFPWFSYVFPMIHHDINVNHDLPMVVSFRILGTGGTGRCYASNPSPPARRHILGPAARLSARAAPLGVKDLLRQTLQSTSIYLSITITITIIVVVVGIPLLILTVTVIIIITVITIITIIVIITDHVWYIYIYDWYIYIWEVQEKENQTWLSRYHQSIAIQSPMSLTKTPRHLPSARQAMHQRCRNFIMRRPRKPGRTGSPGQDDHLHRNGDF